MFRRYSGTVPRMRRTAVEFGAGCFAFLALIAGSGAAEDVLHARVSFSGSSAMVKGSADADWSFATINTLVLPGDTLWVDKEGTLELEMAGGTFLRMADGTKAEVVSLPPSGYIRGWTGSFYVHRTSRSTGDVVFETPATKVVVDRDSQVRIDVLSNGAATISVRWGRVTLQTEGGNDVRLENGERSYVDPGYLPSEPMPFDRSAEDDFDMWNRERARLLAVGTDAIPPAVAIKSEPIGLADLGTYGEWVSVDSAYYWRPTVVTDFVPYRYGHWSFVPACGYVWVADYPFGYVTAHYGRWWHHPSYGWLWGYRDGWSPAWVASVHYGSNFVWCPLDPWDVPVVTTTEYFSVGGLRLGIFASTYCPVDDLLMGPCVVFPCTPIIVRDVPVREINIWNINIGGPHDHFVNPFRGTTIPVRDYAPRRAIRGPEVMGAGRQAARARVASLEGSGTRFRAIASTERRSVRTPADASTRAAQPRNVRVGAAEREFAGGLAPRTVGTTGPSHGTASRAIRSTTVAPPAKATARSGRSERDLPSPMRSRAIDRPRSLTVAPDEPSIQQTVPERRTPSTRSRATTPRALEAPKTRTAEPPSPPASQVPDVRTPEPARPRLTAPSERGRARTSDVGREPASVHNPVPVSTPPEVTAPPVTRNPAPSRSMTNPNSAPAVRQAEPILPPVQHLPPPQAAPARAPLVSTPAPRVAPAPAPVVSRPAPVAPVAPAPRIEAPPAPMRVPAAPAGPVPSVRGRGESDAPSRSRAVR